MEKFNIPDTEEDVSFDDTLCSTCVHSQVCHFVYALAELADAGCVCVAVKCAHYIEGIDIDEINGEGAQ